MDDVFDLQERGSREIVAALHVMAEAIRKRFYPAAFFRTHCRFVEPLRSEARFDLLVREAERREAVARQAVAGVL